MDIPCVPQNSFIVDFDVFHFSTKAFFSDIVLRCCNGATDILDIFAR
jgi:hypothetical protein